MKYTLSAEVGEITYRVTVVTYLEDAATDVRLAAMTLRRLTHPNEMAELLAAFRD